jgi:hypothetical protein
VRFSANGGADATEYGPLKTKVFVVAENNQQYVYKSFIMELDNTPDDLAKVDTNKEPLLKPDTVFGQLIAGGMINLYYVKDNRMGKVHFLVQKGNDPALELIDNSFYLDNSKQIYLKNEKFKKQLRSLTLDDASVTIDRINSLKFGLKDLRSFVVAFNQHMNRTEQTPYQFKEERFGSEWDVFAGVSFNHLAVNGLITGSTVQFVSQTAPEAGLGLNLIIPRSDRALSFRCELGYMSFQGDATGINANLSWSEQLRELHFSSSYLRLGTLFRYTYPYSPLHPYAEAGLVNGYAVTIDEYETDYNFVSQSTEKNRNLFTSLRRYEQSYCVGLGGTYKKYGVAARYEKGNGFSTASSVGTTTQRIQILISYRF